MESVQLAMVLSVVALALIGLAIGGGRLFGEIPMEIWDNALGVAVVTALLGAVAWCAKWLAEHSPLRAEMLIREILSDGNPRTFDSLINEARHRGRRRTLKVMPGALTDAVAKLVANGVVRIEAEKYTLHQ